MANFSQMTSSFFDELSNIKDQERKDREKDLDTHYDRPFSSMLTQDEEPTEEANPNTFDLEEPEVVVRSGA
jgi:hypothetical protein